ncbi:hypothetical protein UT300005_19620 [Clostridium sp. CTA-5]
MLITLVGYLRSIIISRQEKQKNYQIKYKLRKYIFLGAENIYDFFNPAKYGLEPEEIATDCWKGFRCDFSIRNNNIYLDNLKINGKSDEYPDINGVKVGKVNYEGYHVYKKLNLKLIYSGKVIIGTELKKRFIGRAFLNPGDYKKIIELSFQNGEIIGIKDITDTFEEGF